MQNTTNYNLKLYEGTDLFNPLIVENVNVNDLDSIVKGISDAAVGRATELLTGSVHALTRIDTDRNYIAFTATANFTAGDTFTLDGAQVSAFTPDGQTLATGAYIIGSEVLVLVQGTRLTFILTPAKAPDADKLDGHDSSYFAKDSDMGQAQQDIVDLSTKVGTAVLQTTAQNLSDAVNELDGKIDGLIETSVELSKTSSNFGEIVITAEDIGGVSIDHIIRIYLTSGTGSRVFIPSRKNTVFLADNNLNILGNTSCALKVQYWTT